jgi:nucleoside-diphosphate-sugar epimerase
MNIVPRAHARSSPATVLVIGANGFIGQSVVGMIQAHPDLRAIAGVRRAAAGMHGCEQRLCDATDRQSLRDALQGVDAVVCCVLARGRDMVTATSLLCEEASAHPALHRLVLLSSMAVYGAAEGAVLESAPIAGAASGGYARAKAECERIAQQFITRGVPITILRPGIVYGPGGQQWVGRFARMLQAGRLGDLGARGDGICNLVHKDDVAAGALAAIEIPAATGRAFNLADGEDGTWNEYFISLGCLLNVPRINRITSRRLRLEAWLAAPLIEAVSHAVPGACRSLLPDRLSPSTLRLFAQRIRLSPRAATDTLRLAWTPRRQGIAASAEWFLSLQHGRSRPMPVAARQGL